MGFKYLKKFLYLPIFYDLATYSMAWEVMLGKIYLGRLLCSFLVPLKLNRSHIGAFSLVYTFGSNHLNTVVLFHSVRWMCETVIWNIQEAGTKLVLYVPFCECVSPDVQHSSSLVVGGLSEIGGCYIAMHCHSPVNKL